MNKKNRQLWSAALASSLISFSACSSKNASQSGTNNDPNAINATNPASLSTTMSAIEGLLNSLNAEGSSSGTAKISDRTLTTEELSAQLKSAKYSGAGCRVRNEFERAKSSIKRDGSATLCRVDKVVKAAGIELSNTYQTLKLIGVPDGKDGSEKRTMLVRVKTEGTSKLLLDLCPQNSDGSFSHKQAWSAESSEADGVKGVKINIQQNDIKDKRKNSLSLEAYGTTEDLTKISMKTRWDDSFGKGSVDAKADKTEKLIYVDGSFESTFTNQLGNPHTSNTEMCGYMSKGKGAGKEHVVSTDTPFTLPNSSTLSCGFVRSDTQSETLMQPIFTSIPPGNDGKCHRDITRSQAFKNFKIVIGSETIEFIAEDTGPDAEALIAKLSQCEIDENPIAPDALATTWDCSEAGATTVNFDAVTGGFEACDEGKEVPYVDCFQKEREAQEKQGARL